MFISRFSQCFLTIFIERKVINYSFLIFNKYKSDIIEYDIY